MEKSRKDKMTHTAHSKALLTRFEHLTVRE